MKLIKINKNYDSDPNLSEPIIKIRERKVYLQFLLNPHTSDFKEGGKGEIAFYQCIAFRSGSPNDEGFHIDPKNQGRINNNSIWNAKDFPDIEFGSFYEVENSDWSSIVDYDGYVNQKMMNNLENKDKFKHFVFFMKEGTFECVAESYEEHIPI